MKGIRVWEVASSSRVRGCGVQIVVTKSATQDVNELQCARFLLIRLLDSKLRAYEFLNDLVANVLSLYYRK
jgi:hypothetical protein